MFETYIYFKFHGFVYVHMITYIYIYHMLKTQRSLILVVLDNQ